MPINLDGVNSSKTQDYLQQLYQQITVDHNPINQEQGKYLIDNIPIADLIKLAHTITKECANNQVSLCSITNVKSGKCTEDCKWCAQSLHYQTQIAQYDIKEANTCEQEALNCYKQGVEYFSLVASGRKQNKIEVQKLIAIIDHLKQKVPIKLCVSLGLCNEDTLRQLREHGIERYHCNLESSPSYFGKLCTSHTIEDKINTLKLARKVGMQLCSGGIIGMGESVYDRLELALTLQELDVQSIPINILHPIKGTPLEQQKPLSEEEILQSIALFRLANPQAHLRFAGGRILLSAKLIDQCIYTGINAAIVGDLLTTLGSDIKTDRQRFLNHHYQLPTIPVLNKD